jgi:hypothetical protein
MDKLPATSMEIVRIKRFGRIPGDMNKWSAIAHLLSKFRISIFYFA